MRRFLLLCAATALMMPAVEAANIVINGSFETPALTNGTVGYFGSIPGWSLAYGSFIEIQNNVAGSPCGSCGDQFVELDSVGQSGIYQDLATTPGAKYSLYFGVSARPGVADNRMGVIWDGSYLGSISLDGSGNSDTVWLFYGGVFTASGSTTRLQFNGEDFSDSLGMYLDVVSVERVVPEPGTWVMLGVGLAALGGLRRKR